MSIIKKKTWPDYFEKVKSGVKSGVKNFDLRIADFDIKEGDTLILEEWSPEINDYTGRKIAKEVTFVLKTKDAEFWKQEDIDKYGFQVISFK